MSRQLCTQMLPTKGFHTTSTTSASSNNNTAVLGSNSKMGTASLKEPDHESGYYEDGPFVEFNRGNSYRHPNCIYETQPQTNRRRCENPNNSAPYQNSKRPRLDSDGEVAPAPKSYRGGREVRSNKLNCVSSGNDAISSSPKHDSSAVNTKRPPNSSSQQKHPLQKNYCDDSSKVCNSSGGSNCFSSNNVTKSSGSSKGESSAIPSNSTCNSTTANNNNVHVVLVDNNTPTTGDKRPLSDDPAVTKRESSGETSEAARMRTEKSDSVVCTGVYNPLELEIEEISRIRTAVQLANEEKVDMTHFDPLKVLGTGAYGKVYLVRKKGGSDHGKLYAMKVLKKATIVQKKKTAEHTRTERQVLEAIRQSPFLVGMHYAFQTETRLYLVLDYVSGGELFTHLYKNEHFTEDEVRIYIAEVVLALEQLHKLGIIYRDIKLENILLDANGHIVLTDFGLSKELHGSNERAYSFCGTLEYMAPEVVRGGSAGHDTAVDWWSVGVLTYELLTGASPFTVVDERNTQHDISRRILKTEPPIPDELGSEVKDFISKLLVKDPKKRLGGSKADASQIKSHPFFRKVDWTKLSRKQIPAPFKPKIESELDTSNFSDEFTRLPLNDSPAAVPPNSDRLFRGYSFVASRHLNKNYSFEYTFSDSNDSDNKSFNQITFDYNKNSPFFAKYEPVSKPIGHGSFSVCMECINRTTRQSYAVKIMKNSKEIDYEIETLKICQGCPNIVKLIEVLRDNENTYIVMEYLSGGELLDRIRESSRFTEDEAGHYFCQIVKAVSTMHAQNIVHRDLKPENILFTESGSRTLKIVDFGFARQRKADQIMSPPCFTLDYAAPEVLTTSEENACYNDACDIWSLGVILYTMLCGHAPFRKRETASSRTNANSIEEIVKRIKRGSFDTESNAWQFVSRQAKDLVQGLLTVDARNRLKIDQVLQHEWFRKVPTTALYCPNRRVSFDQVADEVRDTFDAFTQAREQGFRLQDVEAANLAKRRRQKKSSSASAVSYGAESITSGLGRSKSSSGIVASDPNNRSSSVATSNSSSTEIILDEQDNNNGNGKLVGSKGQIERCNESKDSCETNSTDKPEYKPTSLAHSVEMVQRPKSDPSQFTFSDKHVKGYLSKTCLDNDQANFFGFSASEMKYGKTSLSQLDLVIKALKKRVVKRDRNVISNTRMPNKKIQSTRRDALRKKAADTKRVTASTCTTSQRTTRSRVATKDSNPIGGNAVNFSTGVPTKSEVSNPASKTVPDRPMTRLARRMGRREAISDRFDLLSETLTKRRGRKQQ
ncbi:unnamed protein product [Hermetia illucens]|uniref:non-specific serine/threonine protein kinase n=2 Tax=Hermetia illucens TaxID=343691 RepID=A0A7R8ULV8_HERIL|nr:unnamed protein product [Hermetia illucens]